MLRRSTWTAVYPGVYTRVVTTPPASPLTDAELRAIADPVQRIEAARRRDAELRDEAAAVARVVRDAAQEMHQTMSYAEMAAALGVTRARAQQLTKPS